MGDFDGQELIQAAIFDDYDFLSCLLEGECANFIDCRDTCGRTAVYTAVSNNSQQCLKLLLQRGADPNIASNEKFNCMTPLHSALVDGKKDIVELLLKYGADLNIKNASGQTPVQLAQTIARQDLIDLISNEKAVRDLQMAGIRDDFMQACRNKDVDKVTECIKKMKTSDARERMINDKCKDGLSPLCLACKNGWIDLATLLLDHGADSSTCTENGYGPIHIACEHNELEMLKVLLKNCPEVVKLKTSNDQHQPPIHVAVMSGHLDVIKTIFEFRYPDGVLEDYQDIDEQYTYSFAFDINSIDSEGRTALYLAAEEGEKNIVEYLLNFKLKAKSLAKKQKRKSLSAKDVFIDFHPVKLNTTSKNGLRPLHIAIKNRYYDVIDLLLKHKAVVNCTVVDSNKMSSALILACENKDSLVLDKLLQNGAEDSDKSVFKIASKNQPNVVPTLLKYRTFKDPNHHINKNGIRKRYLDECYTFSENSSSMEFSSVHCDYKARFPVNPVQIRWNELDYLTVINEEWIMDAAYHHNPNMTSINSSFSLFAVTSVDLSGNHIGVSFPSALFKLPSLQYLNISNNRIENFPGEISIHLEWECLQELKIDHNRLGNLPVYIVTLPALKILSLSHNYVSEIPVELWGSESLVVVNLSENRIHSLESPMMKNEPNIGSSSSPRNSPFEEIRSEINHSSENEEKFFPEYPEEDNIKHVNYWNSNVKVSTTEYDLLYDSRSSKPGLHELDLSGNELTDVPVWLSCCCPCLETLNLSKNRISSVRNIGCYPPNLKNLDLSNNKYINLKPWSLSDSVSASMQICYSIRSNKKRHLSQGGCIHRQHTELAYLDTLNISNNDFLREIQVTKLSSTHHVTPQNTGTGRSRGSSASSVDSTNSFHVPGDEIMLFPSLTSLDLSSNKNLTSLPKELGYITSLKRLSISKSGVKELPPQLGLLKHLFTLEIDRCPLEGPLQDIIRHSTMLTRDILGFLLSVLEDSVEYNSMNLMFVGTHDIGKTTLLRRLQKKRRAGYPPVTTWLQRMSGNQAGVRLDGGTLSTVGIDIDELTIGEKRSNGQVTFRTWDFGGQTEYYATHQYFLSQRSLYLVMWNLKHGEEGVHGIWQWLVNIQARAPGAPVIIVGTHKDVLDQKRSNYPKSFEDDLNEKIDKIFISVEEPEKCGLPNVIGRINVSCTKGDNIDKLVDLIYDKVFELKHPIRRTEKLLRHKVPKKYLILQDIVKELAKERVEEQKKDPVLDRDSYLLKTMNKMQDKAGIVFRDVEDVEQATRFLHENGILFHYEDLALKDLYFLNPQWLCDQLAQVVTVEHVHRFIKNGIMQAHDLQILFKKSTFQPENIEQYIIGLLAKFELALQFDQTRLLLPSLLPSESKREVSKIKIPLQKPQNMIVNPQTLQGGAGTSTLYSRDGSSKPNLSSTGSHPLQDQNTAQKLRLMKCKHTNNVTFAYCRLYVMTYFPSGFWPRLITKVLADSSLYEVVSKMYPLPADILNSCARLRNNVPEWQPWQTGIELVQYDTVLFRIKEVQAGESGLCSYTNCNLQCYFDDSWTDLDLINSVVMEICFPSDSITFSFVSETDQSSFQSLIPVRKEQVFRDEKASAKLMTKVTDHIDTLLQDWYPEIGESRFVQNCFGRYLITRVIPCSHCLHQRVQMELLSDKSAHWQYVNEYTNEVTTEVSQLVEEEENKSGGFTLYCFLVERCIMNFLNGYNELCLKHGSVSPAFMISPEGNGRTLYIAPDVAFHDLDSGIIVNETDNLTMIKKLGRGSFGDVYSGVLKRIEEPSKDVAIKILCKDQHRVHQQSGMLQLYMENACSAYLTARQEVSILLTLQHDNIVPLLGLSVRPLALLLSLAPHGSLQGVLSRIREDGHWLSVFTIKQIIIQVADALSYLHSKSIIYRDLKSDNVLVWHMPMSKNSEELDPVTVKLADYGISRTVLPAGMKGYGGTLPFIAPEILQHAGRNTYSEKVDIFSFGMFMYELLTCKLPLEDIVNTTLYICQNGRPYITSRELKYPSHLIDLMCVCWSHDPNLRPSAQGIQMVASSAQFCHVMDAVSMEATVNVFAGCSVFIGPNKEADINMDELQEETEELVQQTHNHHTQVWLSTKIGKKNCCLEVYKYDSNLRCTTKRSVAMETGHDIQGMVCTDKLVWCFDTLGSVHVYDSVTGALINRRELEKVEGPVRVLNVQHLTNNTEDNILLLLVNQRHSSSNNAVLVKLPVEDKGDNSQFTPLYFGGFIYGSAILNTSNGIEIWAGQNGGKITIINLNNPTTLYKVVDHFSIPNERKNCIFLETYSAGDRCYSSVWSYNHPGTVINRWNTKTYEIEGELNCAHVVPLTESHHISLNHSFEATRYQVTAMKILNKYLYAGTTWGCIIVADAISLQPYTAFRCHNNEEPYIKSILPLYNFTEASSTSVSGVVTVGKGYRDLITHLPNMANIHVPSSQNEERDDRWELINSVPMQPFVEERGQLAKNTFILSWFAKNWEFY